MSLRERLRELAWRALVAGGFREREQSASPVPPAGSSDEELLVWNREMCSWPTLYYTSVQEFLRACQVKSFVEVGVAYGYHAEFILAGLPGVRYVGVDPYRANYDDDDGFCSDVGRLFNCGPVQAMDRLHDVVSRRIESQPDARGTLIRAASLDAAPRFEDASIDAVFIDGDHRYEAVTADLKAWWPKLRPGGVLLGDDYDDWPSVARAWNEFTRDNALTHFFVVNAFSAYRTVAIVK